MKVTKLTIHNIGKIGDTVITLDKPLILFYGEIRQGKTTILNAVRWVCGGEWPTDIITHGKDDAHIELEFDGGMITRSWYRGKDEKKETKARPVTFIRNGKPVPSPVAEIKRFLNPFLIDQDHLRNKSELERKQFFAELFAVDTTDLEKEWFNNDRDASNLRVAIKSYGEIDLTPVERVDIAVLQAELSKTRNAHDVALEKVQAKNETIRKHNITRGELDVKRAGIAREMQRIETEIKGLQQQLASLKAESTGIVIPAVKELQPLPTRPDTAALEQKLQAAGAANVRAEQYEANKKRAEEKKDKEAELAKLEARQREIKKEKQARLKTISDSCGIKELSFDDAGNFIYQGTQAGMLSTSQIMRLSSELSALYPEGFGLELLDRGESLGKSIFEFVDRAKEEKKTILATIVGEHPARVPKDVGVFVVNDGKVQEEKQLAILP